MDILPMDRQVFRQVNGSIDVVHNRDYPEQAFLGLEFNLLDVLSLRGGYNTHTDDGGVSLWIRAQAIRIGG